MCQLHKIHPRAFNACGLGQGVVGSDADSLVKAKDHPNLLTYTYTPAGPEIMSLISGIIAAGSLFDSGSLLIDDLLKMKLRLERASRGFLSVDHTWKRRCVPLSSASPRSSTRGPSRRKRAPSPDCQAPSRPPTFSGGRLMPKPSWYRRSTLLGLHNRAPAPAAAVASGAKASTSPHSRPGSGSLSPPRSGSWTHRGHRGPAAPPPPLAARQPTATAKSRPKAPLYGPTISVVVCDSYKAGKACSNGAECHRYCYLSKDRSCFSS